MRIFVYGQTTVSEAAINRNIGRRFFGTFRAVANIIMQRHRVSYWLSSDPKMFDLE